MRRIILIILILTLLVAAFIFRAPLLTLGQEAWSATASLLTSLGARLGLLSSQEVTGSSLLASGTIEARTLSVASTAGGRVARLHVVEGQHVQAGVLIAEMDTALLDAEIEQARAAVVTAQAQLALLQAGARPADLDTARAAVAQAASARDAARVAWEDAVALVSAPAELDVKIASAASAAAVAEQQVIAAQAAATAADLEQALWGRIVKLLAEGFDVPLPGGGEVHVDSPPEKLAAARLQWNLASQSTWQAHARANTTAAARDTARQTLADLRVQKANPQALRTQADAAETAYRVAEAALGVAQANLDVLLAGAAGEQIEATRALVDQADAAVAALKIRKEQARLVAPQAGTVSAVVLAAGEVAGAGSPIVRLADLQNLTLTVYVPELELGKVQLGQAVQVVVDSFPDRTFAGAVTHIADQAEYTPKNVQTRQERTNTVFAVKIALGAGGGALKPGMPADACFGGQECGSSVGRGLSASAAPPSEMQFSGTVEATETTVSAELGGRVMELAATEGDTVSAGQVLVRLEGSELAARRVQAAAAVAAARAELARVVAPPQQARVMQAQTQVKQAQAVLEGAQAALADATKARLNPYDLDAQINSARAQAHTAETQIDLARAQLKAAQVLQESLPADAGSDEDRTRLAIYDQGVQGAQAALAAAEAQHQGSLDTLNQLLAIRKDPVALDAGVHRAEGLVAQAQASLKLAQANLAAVSASAQPEAVAVAMSRVAQAEAALGLVEATQAKLAIGSPSSGTVTGQMIHPGEVAQPGVPLLTVVNLRQVKLIIYVPTAQIGWVRLGQPTEIRVDAYPGRTFAGTVAHIADEVEFTPKNVQTQEERVKTVFGVEIALQNEEGLLKPGMPADAVLAPQ